MKALLIVAVVLFGVGACAPTQTPVVRGAPTPTTAPPPNPGFGNYCDFGPLDDDVRGVVRASTETTRPECEDK
jgi:hypothetical protein